MMRKLRDVEGIGPAYAQRLNAAGVRIPTDLLYRAGSARDRAELAAQTGIGRPLILKWANRIDLMRISGIGKQYAELLEAAGVDTVRELALRKAASLSVRMAEINARKKAAGASPAESQVRDWIAQAQNLAPKILC